MVRSILLDSSGPGAFLVKIDYRRGLEPWNSDGLVTQDSVILKQPPEWADSALL